MDKSYRILSLDASYIYAHEVKYGIDSGYHLPDKEKEFDEYIKRFRNTLDYSLDTIELKRIYNSIIDGPFSFSDKYGNDYTCAVINVTFNQKYAKPSEEQVSEEHAQCDIKRPEIRNTGIKELREYFYTNGFKVNGVKYIRYKRSAGSSREGKCLFIDERLYDAMIKWSECGLSAAGDLASWEAYKALSLSSIKDTVDIPLDGILFVPDFKSTFEDEVVSVEMKGGELIAEAKPTEITNDIWDGESLLDESLFVGRYSGKHMMLLRNRFFKSCAFRTKLQKWIDDKKITLESLKARGFVTLATDVSQIVMVTTPNSLKYLKFVGGLSEDNIRSWASNIDSNFGVVKWDKRTKFFGGRMVQSSYQILNTIGLSKQQAEELACPSIDYLKNIRNDIDFMRYHFSDVIAKESNGDFDEEVEYGEENDNTEMADRAEVIFRLMNLNCDFKYTDLYKKFRDRLVVNQKKKIHSGSILLSGTNATLLGNAPELLKFIAGEEVVSTLKPGQIRCEHFPNRKQLLCCRSPHITMGNLYCVENNLDGDIWDYFDLGENIVCVNAIGENIQQRLNGCDYDSDAMLITDNEMLVEAARVYSKSFYVPVCNIKSSGAANSTLAELDYKTSENKIGEIVNLSQKLNCIIWDKFNNSADDIWEIYMDVCKLAVLSGLEIDKAKRAYDNVNTTKELELVRNKYKSNKTDNEDNSDDSYLRPRFFKEIDANKKQDRGEKQVEYGSYDSTMDYVSQIKIDFHKGSQKFAKKISVSAMLNIEPMITSKDDVIKDKVIKRCTQYRDDIDNLRAQQQSADSDDKKTLRKDMINKRNECYADVTKLIKSENILYLAIKELEKSGSLDWSFYAPILNTEIFSRVLNRSKEKLATIIEDPLGKFNLHGFKYTKITHNEI